MFLLKFVIKMQCGGFVNSTLFDKMYKILRYASLLFFSGGGGRKIALDCKMTKPLTVNN